MPSPERDALFLARSNGQAPNGEVYLDDFDRGVIETLGATVEEYDGPRGSKLRAHFWKLPSVQSPPGYPGVPVILGPAEDYHRYKIPYILVVPSNPQAALQRWHPGMIEYRAPAPGARPLTVAGRTGFDRYVEKQQAHPFDLPYTLSIITKRATMPQASSRGPDHGPVGRVEGGSSNQLLTEVLRVYPAQFGMNVLDSAQDYRTYSGSMTGISRTDRTNEPGDRVMGYDVSIVIYGELDLDPVTERPAVSRPLTRRLTPA